MRLPSRSAAARQSVHGYCEPVEARCSSWRVQLAELTAWGAACKPPVVGPPGATVICLPTCLASCCAQHKPLSCMRPSTSARPAPGSLAAGEAAAGDAGSSGRHAGAAHGRAAGGGAAGGSRAGGGGAEKVRVCKCLHGNVCCRSIFGHKESCCVCPRKAWNAVHGHRHGWQGRACQSGAHKAQAAVVGRLLAAAHHPSSPLEGWLLHRGSVGRQPDEAANQHVPQGNHGGAATEGDGCA